MYSPLLSVLLMGILPFHGEESVGKGPMQLLPIAPPLLSASRSPESQEHRTELPQKFSASGVLILDRQSGQTLLAKEANIPLPMASLTKIMTALLIVEKYQMEEWVTIPTGVQGVGGESIHLKPGEQFTVGDLLSALLIGSANDAAYSLAMHHSGSLELFVAAMNTRARELGLLKTSYQNPIGFDADLQWSTPQDIAWLTMFALRSEDIRRRMGMRGAILQSRSGTPLSVTHTHALLHAENGVVAGKTGTTNGARQCLLSVVRGNDDREYIVVLLHSADRYADMRAIVRALTS